MEYQTVQAISAFTGLILFILLFGGVVFYATRPKNRGTFDQAAQMPLENSERPEK